MSAKRAATSQSDQEAGERAAVRPRREGRGGMMQVLLNAEKEEEKEAQGHAEMGYKLVTLEEYLSNNNIPDYSCPPGSDDRSYWRSPFHIWDEVKKKNICKICGRLLAPAANRNNFWHHFNTTHGDIFKECRSLPHEEALDRIDSLYQALKPSGPSQSDITSYLTRTRRTGTNQLTFELRLLLAITRNNWSFNSIQNTLTRKLLTSGNLLKVPSIDTLKRLLRICHGMFKYEFANNISSETPYMWSIDGFSGRSATKLVGMNYIYIEETTAAGGILVWRRKDVFVDCFQIDSAHTSAILASTIKNKIFKSTPGILVSICTDNGANYKKMSLDFVGEDWIPCIIHTAVLALGDVCGNGRGRTGSAAVASGDIQIAADLMQAVRGPFRSSFIKAQRQVSENKKPLEPISPSETRWFWIVDLLDRILATQAALRIVCSGNEDLKLPDFDRLIGYQIILVFIRRKVKAFEAMDKGASMVPKLIYDLFSELQVHENDGPHLVELRRELLIQFKDRMGDALKEDSVVVRAACLDPNNGNGRLELYCGKKTVDAAWKSLEEEAKAVYKEDELPFVNFGLQRLRFVYSNLDYNGDCFTWWTLAENELYRNALGKLAKMFLCIVAASSSTESGFSSVSLAHSEHRALLTPQNIERLAVLSRWLRTEDVDIDAFINKIQDAGQLKKLLDWMSSVAPGESLEALTEEDLLDEDLMRLPSELAAKD